MQNSQITKLNNQELHLEVKNLASQERKLTEKILWHIAEVDARKLYLGMAYSSLFEYLTKEIGYTAGSAQRRIDAARLLLKLPEVADKIKEGSLNLGQISKLQCVQRQFKKESGLAVSLTEQRVLLQDLENKSLEQTDLILAKHFNLDVKTHETKQIQKDESVRIELTFSKAEMAILQKAQELLSNQTGGSLKATILKLAKKSLKAKQNMRSDATISATLAVNLPLANAKSARYVPAAVKRSIFTRDKHCQFTDRNTNKICGSKYFLEIDHVVPKHQNGSNELENLRLLCASHNKYRYQKALP